ncbi:GtrA family protein [Dysgonomonas sp. ZJ279]|uniref:GtrA family protein n=1 Tax=Dysgonomonas sp. ZJ279 TaxID=2709796 RepID=UPI0013EC9A74|nr:GtrA family protein [Dysgonomonas sp. ZJ279]
MKNLFDKLIKNKLTQQKSFRQLIKYGMVGVVGLIIDMSIYYLLVNKFAVHYAFSPHISNLLGGNMSVLMLNILISNIISQTLAVINNFVLNSYFTFKVTDNKIKRFFSFVGIACIGMVVSSVLLTLFIGVIGLNNMVAKVFAVLIVAMMQFVINKLFTFREKKE